MKRINIYQFATVAIVLIFAIHVVVPSYTNGFPKPFNKSALNLWNNQTADELFHARYNFSEFRRRPIVIEIQKFLNEKLAFPYQFSFNVINFTAFFFVFILIFKLGDILTGIKSNFAVLLFLLTKPIIFAFYGSICTYDDIVQYLFLLLCILFLFRKQPILSALMMLVAIIARETSIVYYLIIFGYYWIERTKISISEIGLWMLPILFYALFLNVYLPNDLIAKSGEYLVESRFHHWFINFGSLRSFSESSAIIFSLTIPYLFILFIKYNNAQDIKVKKWCVILFLFIVVNTLIVSISALVRESRLFVLPLLFLIPYCTGEIQRIFTEVFKKLEINFKFALLSALIAFWWYQPFVNGTGYIFKLYLFFQMYFFLVVITHKSLLLNFDER